jgi:outer membrane protein OmpA-like peptidoglycan-associated protein
MSRAFRLGILVVAGLVILAAGIFLIGDKRFLFRRTYRLQAEFQTVAGLNNGAEVRVGGIHLGTVKYISLPSGPNGKLTVAMNMASTTANILRQDSVATIKTEGLLGEKYVEISFGSEKAPPIESGATIKGETPVEFSDAAPSATNQTRAAAGDLNKNRISKLPPQTASKEFVYDAQDIFDKPDNAKLKNKSALDPAGKFLEQNKFRLVVIAASSATGDTVKDSVVTQARAKVVRDYLVQNFKFDDTRVKIIGLGKSSKAGEDSKAEILVYN